MTAVWCMACGAYRHWVGACPNVDRAARLERRLRRIRAAVEAARWVELNGR